MRLSLFTLPLLLLLSSCGGSTASNDDEDLDVTSLLSIAGLDGDVKASNEINASGEIMSVGLLLNGRQCRAFVTFDLTSFNINDNVDSAGLSLSIVSQSGSPFTTFGPIMVEDVDLAGSLNDTDYDLPPVTGVTTLNSSTHRAVVTSMVQAAILANRPRISFRLRFNITAPAGTFVEYATREHPLPPPTLNVALGEPNV